MSISHGQAEWNGELKGGQGTMKPAHAPAIGFSLGTRFEGEQGSNPEELVGSALAGCFSMALAGALGKEGMKPKRIETTAAVTLGKDDVGFVISKIELTTRAQIEGADQVKFEHIARATKESCPVSKALLGTTVTLHAELI
jgi:osmotically inducible protein OsmC